MEEAPRDADIHLAPQVCLSPKQFFLESRLSGIENLGHDIPPEIIVLKFIKHVYIQGFCIPFSAIWAR